MVEGGDTGDESGQGPDYAGLVQSAKESHVLWRGLGALDVWSSGELGLEHYLEVLLSGLSEPRLH